MFFVWCISNMRETFFWRVIKQTKYNKPFQCAVDIKSNKNLVWCQECSYNKFMVLLLHLILCSRDKWILSGLLPKINVYDFFCDVYPGKFASNSQLSTSYHPSNCRTYLEILKISSKDSSNSGPSKPPKWINWEHCKINFFVNFIRYWLSGIN